MGNKCIITNGHKTYKYESKNKSKLRNDVIFESYGFVFADDVSEALEKVLNFHKSQDIISINIEEIDKYVSISSENDRVDIFEISE